MSFQKCPACDGAGWTRIGFPIGDTCSVCRGQKIINNQTGTPPYEVITTTSVIISQPTPAVSSKDEE